MVDSPPRSLSWNVLHLSKSAASENWNSTLSSGSLSGSFTAKKMSLRQDLNLKAGGIESGSVLIWYCRQIYGYSC